jgi:hypothetical protein
LRRDEWHARLVLVEQPAACTVEVPLADKDDLAGLISGQIRVVVK